MNTRDELETHAYTNKNTYTWNTSNNIIVINSIDRDWYNYPNETPYNFLVKLGGTSKDKFSIVSHNYKNIVAFSIDKMILPNRICMNSSNSSVSPRLNDNSYLAVIAKGINYSSYGTNRTLNETIGIYTPLIPLPLSLSNVAYLEFKNSSSQLKEYIPTPEPYISQLDLSITTPSGVIASNINDTLEIYSIFLDKADLSTPVSTSDTLIIQTKTYFTSNEFIVNDLISISNYQYYNMSYDESSIFNNWINTNNTNNNNKSAKQHQHYISSITKSNSATSLYNQIHIPVPAVMSTTTGNIAVNTWFTDFITKSLSNVAIADVSGKLINVNTQTHFIVNIKTVNKTNLLTAH